MAVNQGKKRRAMSVSEMANGDSMDREPRRKSGYSGPKRPRNDGSGSVRSSVRSVDDYDRKRREGSTYVNTIDGHGYAPKAPKATKQGGSSKFSLGGYVAPSHAGGIMDYAWIVYVAVLSICLMTSMIAFSKSGGSGNGKGIYYPRDLVTTNGVLDIIFDEYYSGGLGSRYAMYGPGDNSIGVSGQNGDYETVGDGTSTDGDSTPLPNSTTGATMALDTGGAYESYAAAGSHEEVVAQLESALSSGDVQFVGRKLAYEDESSGNLIGYPQSVVEHFVSYMSSNPDKRALFISEVGGDKFTAKNADAFVVKIPLLKFTVNMGYDDTTLSISGFSDQTLSSGQSATVQPLLPCMYTITVSTIGGSQSSEVEANMNEGNLQINIGVTN